MTRKSFQITGEATEEQLEKIISLMMELRVEAEVAETKVFDDWLSSVSDEEVDGFYEQVNKWIRSWGNGGGDESTVTMITESFQTDNPKEWAEDAYTNIADYCKSSFEAAALIMLLVDEVLKELQEVPVVTKVSENNNTDCPKPKNETERLTMKKVLLDNEVVQQAIEVIKKHPECEEGDLSTLQEVIQTVENFLNSGEKVLHMDLNLWEGVFDALDSIMEEYGLDYSEEMNWEDKPNGMIIYK